MDDAANQGLAANFIKMTILRKGRHSGIIDQGTWQPQQRQHTCCIAFTDPAKAGTFF